MEPRRRPIAVIDPRRCTGCGWCLPTCRDQLLTLEAREGRKTSTLHDGPACTGCRLCAQRCPFGAITMQPQAPAG